MSIFVQCHQLVKAFQVGGHEIVALRGIDFEMEQGEMVAIIGPSGAGKSTLLDLLGGIDRPTAGELIVGGQNLLKMKERQLAAYRLRRVGFVWQEMERNLMPHRSPLTNVTLPLMLEGVPMWQRRRYARELLNRVGMCEQAHQHLLRLSGGQQQRVAVAVALANDPDLILADEPTGSLDRANAVQVMQLITEMRERYGLTVLMVTHDMEVAHFADRVLTLRDGALGQDLSNSGEAHLVVDEDGRLSLPKTLQAQLATADNIAVEVRPEGILLRPESDSSEMLDPSTLAHDRLPQDAPPPRRQLLNWVLRRGSRHE